MQHNPLCPECATKPWHRYCCKFVIWTRGHGGHKQHTRGRLAACTKHWAAIVDLTTVAWFGIFIVGFMAFDADLIGLETLIKIPESYETAWTAVNWSIWAVFAVDVWFKYRKTGSPREFVRRHWFDLLLLIPFFRVLAILRVLRLMRMLRLARAGLGAYRAYRKTKRFRGPEEWGGGLHGMIIM